MLFPFDRKYLRPEGISDLVKIVEPNKGLRIGRMASLGCLLGYTLQMWDAWMLNDDTPPLNFCKIMFT